MSPKSKSPPDLSTLASSTSSIGILSTLNLQPSDRTDLSVNVVSAGGTSSSMPSSQSNAFDDKMKSTFRDLSTSPVCDEGELPVPEDSDWASWWGDSEKHAARPWYNPPKKKKTVPSEQTEALQSTRKKVAQAIASALGIAADITHEALFIGVDLLELAPVPGLKPAAQLLLNIWDASRLVDMNRLGCLRLTERCADILISVRVEISDAGDVLGQELAAPIGKLEESFKAIHHFLIKQSGRPFLKRYLRRDEILEDISACDSLLRDALGLFSVSIQIRILRQVQEAEKHRQAETQSVLEAISTGRVLPSSDSNMPIGPITSETATHLTNSGNSLGLFDDPALLLPSTSQDLPHSQIIPALTSLHSLRNLSDREMDAADLRQLMRAALQTTNDAEILEVLQVGHQEMPDAIKTLQRALEHVAERDDDGVEASPGKSVVATVLKEVEGPGASRKRSETILSIDSMSSGYGSERRRDTLDREFIESGIDCLRRMSRGIETTLPSWTITKYEVDRDKKIGIGFFSDVYKGTWRGRTVAIKVLADTTPRNLFVREIGIWKTLSHPNVLRLYGASSASGDPPWFFVSSYLKNGSLVQHLKRVELEERPSNLGIGMGSSQMPLSPIRSPASSNLRSGTFPAPLTAVRSISPTRRDLTPPGSRGRSLTPENTAILREWDLFRFMHEIARGMEYLHSEGVLHGDLKGANVLVDDKYRCVISDFGQSEMKSEAYRISGTLPPHGTLRWQAPELMAGQSRLTREIDVWAFSICCVEILTMGRIPWGPHSDDVVRHFVLKDDSRPPLPDNSRFNTQGLQDILRACWSTKATQRPTFSKLVKDFKQLRQTSGQEICESPQAPVIDEESAIDRSPSPDMRPTSLPESYVQPVDNDLPDGLLPDLGDISQTSQQSSDVPDLSHLNNAVSTEGMKVPEAMNTPTPSTNIISASQSDEHLNVIGDGYSPSPVDETVAIVQNERRYRLLLTHDYHPSLTLPLWDPSPVEIGAVGYLCKPQGNFVTLFNAFTPEKANHIGIRSLPSIHGYGPAQPETYRQDKRTVGQKSMDAAASFLTFRPFPVKVPRHVSRHYSYPLKAGHEMACLCTETTDYRYLEKVDAPKKWFKTHIDFIMQTYGGQHQLQKEDLFLVIGTLSAPNYALFVSHRHPEGHTHFNVYATPKDGQPWGTFDTKVLASEHGPSDEEPSDIISSSVEAKKVSCRGGPWNTVLLARLRFKPDVLEPTSM